MRADRIAIVAAWLLIVVAVAYTVSGHERTLRDGQLVLLQLAPVDPRSLMQGDYMALRFAVDGQLPREDGQWPNYAHLHVGAEGRAVLAGAGDEPSSEPGMVSMRIRQNGREASVGPNAFFFQEGTAAVYEEARWGGFRVAADGTALLTALYDENLQLLGSNRR
ncbi:GDYXXLXY domain-containing protein [Pseudomonas sp. MYb185]|uniref:GDYXXLXY domain-containing protein n=1 Tax=Pseudomonas sp. MYb185 TaxID=1848729 RepID=UPI000CFD3799|nr:GDYXXLXY domain-containing protein [Pseudomonas sp. MYb185]PRB81921.1 hypothetical protein CQ007_06970 [Pseudomonas sp. MYb185]